MKEVQTRLFTSPLMSKGEVLYWCKLVRENKDNGTLFENQLKSEIDQLSKNEKAAS